MDEQPPLPDNDLSELERRLGNWQPSAAGLDSDAMLFAAGQAAARAGRGRFVWPLISTCLAGLAVTLGGWLAAERSERLALARKIEQQPAPAPPLPQPSGPASPEPVVAEPPAPNSYLALRRQLEREPDPWADRASAREDSPPPPPPGSPILRAFSRSEVLVP
jgi:hypothetical protein